MKFQKRQLDEPEINLIPFIDVLLVVLIFLMLTMTYSHMTEIKVNLPEAHAQPVEQKKSMVVVTVAHDGRYIVNQRVLMQAGVRQIAQALAEASTGLDNPLVIIYADANASHQQVVNVMDAARATGLAKITFATQKPGSSS